MGRRFNLISATIALSIFVAIWGVREFVATRSTGALALALVFVAGGVALVLYAGRAFRKLKDLS